MERPLHEGVGTPETWLDDHGGALFAYALRRVRSRQIAEDLVQETFLAALKGRHQFAGQSSVQTWLVAILRRKIVDHYRAASRRGGEMGRTATDGEQAASGDKGPPYPPPLPCPPPFDEQGHWRSSPRPWPEPPEARLEAAEFMETLAGCIEELGPTLEAAFRMRIVEQLETEEICSLLEISSTNLSVRLNRARQAIRMCLDARWFGNA